MADLAQRVKGSSAKRQPLAAVLQRTNNVPADLDSAKKQLESARDELTSIKAASPTKEDPPPKAKVSFTKKLFGRSKTKDAPSSGSTSGPSTKVIDAKIKDLTAKRDALQKQLKERVEAEDALEEIYAPLFDGPTPDYPEEDEQEDKFRGAEKLLQASQGDVSNVAQASNTLYTVQMRIRSGLKFTDTALSHTSEDPLMEDQKYVERSHNIFQILAQLRHAHSNGKEAMELLDKAKGMDPEVKDYEQLRLIDSAPYLQESTSTDMSDILKEMITEKKVPVEIVDRKNLQSSKDSFEKLEKQVEEELVRIDARQTALSKKRDEKQDELAAARAELIKFRTQLCDKICA